MPGFVPGISFREFGRRVSNLVGGRNKSGHDDKEARPCAARVTLQPRDRTMVRCTVRGARAIIVPWGMERPRAYPRDCDSARVSA